MRNVLFVLFVVGFTLVACTSAGPTTSIPLEEEAPDIAEGSSISFVEVCHDLPALRERCQCVLAGLRQIREDPNRDITTGERLYARAMRRQCAPLSRWESREGSQ
jgi:hypothetical protein